MNVQDLVAYLIVQNPDYAIRLDDKYGSGKVRDVYVDDIEKEVVIVQ